MSLYLHTPSLSPAAVASHMISHCMTPCSTSPWVRVKCLLLAPTRGIARRWVSAFSGYFGETKGGEKLEYEFGVDPGEIDEEDWEKSRAKGPEFLEYFSPDMNPDDTFRLSMR